MAKKEKTEKPEPTASLTKHPGGRPTDFLQEYVEQAEKLCELGATDEEIADFFGQSVRTIYRWKNSFPEFCQALKIGKELADERVKRSLYQKATGFRYTEEQAIKIRTGQYEEDVEVVEVERRALPDTPSAIFWLKNRCGWTDKTEIQHSGEIISRPPVDPSAALNAAKQAEEAGEV